MCDGLGSSPCMGVVCVASPVSDICECFSTLVYVEVLSSGSLGLIKTVEYYYVQLKQDMCLASWEILVVSKWFW